MDPFSSGCSCDQKRWSEWLESVRKDIECAFGILKARFRLFSMALRFHLLRDIDYAWKSACILHNMNILYAGNDQAEWERNINWSYLDPDFDTLDGPELQDDYIHTMNDYYDREASLHGGGRGPPRGFCRPPVVSDETCVGSEFRGCNPHHYYEKRTISAAFQLHVQVRSSEMAAAKRRCNKTCYAYSES